MLHPDMRTRMLAELQQQAGKHWQVTSDGSREIFRVGAKQRYAVYLQNNRFTANRAFAQALLNEAFVAVQEPQGDNHSNFSYLSLQTGTRIAVSGRLYYQLRIAVVPEPADAVTQIGELLTTRSDGKVTLTTEGLDAMRLARIRHQRDYWQHRS